MKFSKLQELCKRDLLLAILVVVLPILGYLIPATVQNFKSGLYNQGYQQGIEAIIRTAENNGFVNIPVKNEFGATSNLKLIVDKK